MLWYAIIGFEIEQIVRLHDVVTTIMNNFALSLLSDNDSINIMIIFINTPIALMIINEYPSIGEYGIGGNKSHGLTKLIRKQY